jgi:hypothetical protein
MDLHISKNFSEASLKKENVGDFKEMVGCHFALLIVNPDPSRSVRKSPMRLV